MENSRDHRTHTQPLVIQSTESRFGMIRVRGHTAISRVPREYGKPRCLLEPQFKLLLPSQRGESEFSSFKIIYIYF